MVKQLFFSLIFFNLPSSLFCMTSMMQRMRLALPALPTALSVARMPKPYLMPQRNLIYSMITPYNEWRDTRHDKHDSDDFNMGLIIDHSVKLTAKPFITTLRPDLYYFACLASRDDTYLVENNHDVAQIIASLKKVKKPFFRKPHFKIDGQASISWTKGADLFTTCFPVFEKWEYTDNGRFCYPQGPIQWFCYKDPITKQIIEDTGFGKYAKTFKKGENGNWVLVNTRSLFRHEGK